MFFATFLHIVFFLFALLTVGVLLLYIYFAKQYEYWSSRNVPHEKPVFPFGNLKRMQVEETFSLFKKLYDTAKGEKYFGLWFLQNPILMIKDLDLIHKVLIKNYEDFGNHDTYFAPDDDPKAVNLFNLKGDEHRNLKANLMPIFSPLKLQAMVQYMNKSGMALQEFLMERARAKDVIDVKDITIRFAIEAMFYAFFGIDIDFIKNPNSLIGKESLKVASYNWIVMLRFFIIIYMPGLAKKLKVPFVPQKLFNFFNSVYSEIMGDRNRKDILRNDAMQHFTELVNKGYLDTLVGKRKSIEKQEFAIEHVTTQAISFVTPAYLNASKIIPSLLYELAANQTLQEKLRDEIKEVLHQNTGEVTYEAISKMEYLHQVIDETLRKYPTSAVILRACVNDFKDPDSGLTIEKGTYITIPTIGLHYDEEYFPNPEKFDPDRFSKEKKKLIPKCVYLPYGKGVRSCIAQKFSPLLLAMELISLLSKFKFDIPEKHLQLESDPKLIGVLPKEKMVLKISLVE